MFWLFWLIMVVVASIVFLNFIIAEASASYEKVAGEVDQYILKEQANLIGESEVMTPGFLKSENSYPKYIIIRRVDD